MDIDRKGPIDYRPDATTLCVTNCTSDDNKGDYGIVLATFLGIRQAYIAKFQQEPKLFALSAYNLAQTRNSAAHRLLKKLVDRVIAACVPMGYACRQPKSGHFVLRTVSLLLWARVRIGLYRVSFNVFRWLLSKDQKALERCGVIIVRGGSHLYSKGGFLEMARLLCALAPALQAIWLGARPIVFAQSIGPFRSRLSQWLASYTLNHCRRVYVRDQLSREILQELGVVRDRTFQVPDAAFLLRDFVDFAPMPKRQKKIMSISFRRLSTDAATQALFEEKVAFVLERFLEKYPDWIVQCVPQCIGPEKIVDDRIVHRAIRHAMSGKMQERVVLLDEDYAIKELLSLYKGSDLVFGSRLHAAIFGITQGTVPVLLEYEEKKALGTLSMLGLESCVLDWQVEAKKISQRLEKSVATLPELRRATKKAADQASQMLTEACVYIINTLEERG